MNKAEIIKKYEKLNPKARGKLKDGGEIIGEEVDENNFLHYVIKRDKKVSVEMAQHLKVTEFHFTPNIVNRVRKN